MLKICSPNLQAIAAMSIKFSDIIEKYNGNGDFVEWADKLEMVASLQNISDLTNFLPLFLTGGAFTVYKGLDEEIRKDYKKVKSALIDAFSSDKFTVYESLVCRKLKMNESVDVFLADVKRMFKLIDENSSDELIKTAFVFGLPENVKVQLKAACTLSEMTLESVVQRSRALLKNNSDVCCVGQSYQNKNNRENNKSKSVTCYFCNIEGHTRNRCPSLREKRCFKCGEKGHLFAYCPENTKCNTKNE